MQRATVVLTLGLLGAGTAGRAGDLSRPRLNLRATPRTVLSPASVLVVAELKGGGEHEDFYCPALEWEWGDGTRSVQEGDCPPFDADSRLERYFSARHSYGAPGEYSVRVTLRRASRTVVAAAVGVSVHGRTALGAGEY
jgi:hypothetical protein